jgi:hypothetical protein
VFVGLTILSASNDAVTEAVMISKDYKWPSSKRRRVEERNRVISQAIGVAVGLNAVGFSLSVLVPEGLWLALGLLVAGTAFTTALVKDIFSDR